MILISHLTVLTSHNSQVSRLSLPSLSDSRVLSTLSHQTANPLGLSPPSRVAGLASHIRRLARLVERRRLHLHLHRSGSHFSHRLDGAKQFLGNALLSHFPRRGATATTPPSPPCPPTTGTTAPTTPSTSLSPPISSPTLSPAPLSTRPR
ncbi:hypothetical protein Scep_007821 [Stephania cephalantha]|uniref:Uncharacterized protein n=1 Tax=Stephania cephalantha TaxID=152367 RepID=A0AAP0PNL4_9MAGN